MSGIGRIFKRTWKRPDGSIATSKFYSIAFPYKGRERVEGSKCDTEAGARQRLRQRLEEIGRNQFLPGKTPTVREAAKEWLEGRKLGESRRGGSIKESTIDFWRNHIDHYIVPTMGDYRCDRVDTAMVENARDLWKADGRIGGKSVNRILTTLRAIFRKQIARGVIRFNPVDAAERLATRSQEVPDWTDATEVMFAVHHGEVYSPDELRRLLESAKPGFDQAFLSTIALTMIRRGEALGLMWSDIDFEAKEIIIRRSWSTRFRDGKPIFWLPKTKHGIRIIPIPDRLVTLLKRWKLLNASNSHDLVFARPNGRPMHGKAVWMAYRAACEASGVRVLRIHALRHTGASIQLMSGTSLPEVSAMLGHARMDVTLQVYSHFIPTMRSDSAARFDAAVFGPAGPVIRNRV